MFVHSCWAEAWQRWAKVTQPFRNWASVSSVTAGVLPNRMVVAGLSRGPVFHAEAPAVVGELNWVWAGVPAGVDTPAPKARTEVPATAAHWTGCPHRRVLMGPEGFPQTGLAGSCSRGSSPPQGGPVPCSQLHAVPGVPRTPSVAIV